MKIQEKQGLSNSIHCLHDRWASDTKLALLGPPLGPYIPSQTVINPQVNVIAITLRSDKELPQQQQPTSNVAKGKVAQISKHAKFLKELCTHKRKNLKGDVEMARNMSALIKSEQVSSLIQPTMLKKYRNPSTFIVPCTISKCTFDSMLDLGTSINVMPLSIYKSLILGDSEPTSVVIQLANRSTTHPLGILEDVLVQKKIDQELKCGLMSMNKASIYHWSKHEKGKLKRVEGKNDKGIS
ncbi:hypothetical protein CR513_54841, partial [Mucuna pruriens]